MSPRLNARCNKAKYQSFYQGIFTKQSVFIKIILLQHISHIYRQCIALTALLLASLTITTSATAQTCPYDPVKLYFDNNKFQIVKGQQFCVNLKVDNFENIFSATFFISYNSDILRFDSFDPLVSGIPDFDQDILFPSTDLLAFLWSSRDFKGKTIEDGSTLMNLCFTIIGDPGEEDFIELNLASKTGSKQSFLPADYDQYTPECDGDVVIDSVQSKVLVESIPEQTTFPQVFAVDQCGSEGSLSEGVVNLKIFYGTPPYRLTLSNGQMIETSEPNLILTNLPNGSYTVDITDSAGESGSQISFELDETPTLAVDPTIKYPDCTNDNRGSITLGVSGGRPFTGGSYSFKWANQISGRGLNKIIRLESGVYDVVVEDSIGCKSELSFDLSIPPITIESQEIRDALCAGSRRGLASIEFEGGGPNRKYYGYIEDSAGGRQEFAEVDSTLDISLFAGDYSIYVSNSSRGLADEMCIYKFPLTIGTQRDLGATIISTDDASCNSGQMSAVLEINRENTPSNVSYNIVLIKDGNPVFDEVTDQPTITTPCIDTGRYVVRLYDASNGCEFFDTISLMANTIMITDKMINSPQCATDTVGSITVQATSDFLPLSYQWSNGVSGKDANSIDGLRPGTYYVTITDSLGLTLRDSFLVASGDSLSLSLNADPIACAGGTSIIRAVGASKKGNDLLYTWSPDPSGQPGSVLTDVKAGTYTVTMKNSTGCTISDSITLTEPKAPAAQVSNINAPKCSGANEGTATILIIENDDYKEPFFFAASSGATHMGNNFNITDLTDGPNWVVYSDGVCTFDTVYFEVPAASPFSLDTASINKIMPIACHGGTTNVNLAEANGEAVTFRWLDNGSEGNVRLNLGAGSYAIELSKDGCSAIDSITLTEPNKLIATIDSTRSMFAACGGDKDGQLFGLATGGTSANGEYNYAWIVDPLVIGIENVLDSISPGKYVLRIKDDNKCVSTDTIIVTEPSPVVASLGNVTSPTCSGEQGTISIANASGGVGGPYLFQVNTSPTQPISQTATVIPGNFTVRVFDQNGCSWDTMVTITPASTLAVALGPDETIELGQSVNITATVTSDAVVDSVIWSPNADIECQDAGCFKISAKPVVTTTYTVAVTTSDGCRVTDEITVNVNRTSNVYIPNAINPNSPIDENKTFKVYGGAGVLGVGFIRIYDRWGALVHSEEGNQQMTTAGVGSWNGTFKGTNKTLNPGVYTYHTQILFADGGASESRRGTVTLIR